MPVAKDLNKDNFVVCPGLMILCLGFPNIQRCAKGRATIDQTVFLYTCKLSRNKMDHYILFVQPASL